MVAISDASPAPYECAVATHARVQMVRLSVLTKWVQSYRVATHARVQMVSAHTPDVRVATHARVRMVSLVS